MSIEWYPTANSYTLVAYDTEWLVLDVGSGHHPHPRADVLVDRFLLDNEVAGRSGRKVVIPKGKNFVIADARAMPFRDSAFDFVIASHVAEHIVEIDKFCTELTRVGKGGYLETPSKFAEILRHPPYHVWYVSKRNGGLVFESAPRTYPLGWLGKLFFSVYFYQSPQLQGKDVFRFAFGAPQPLHYMLYGLRIILVRLWTRFKSITYMRLLWSGTFSWQVKRR